MKKYSKKGILLLQIFTILTVFSACGNAPAESKTNQLDSSTIRPEPQVIGQADASLDTVLDVTDSGTDTIFEEGEDGPMSITVALWSHYDIHDEPNQWYDRLVEEINAYTGMEINWKWYLRDNYDEQIARDIADGDVADVIIVPRKSDVFVEGIESGLFWEVGPYLEEYENHAAIYETSRFYNSYNGKLYCLPKYGFAEPVNDGLAYRVDWLEKLGLERPTTWEQFKKMLYAFTYSDPDGNGMHDTMGLVMGDRADDWDVMEVWFGVPNVWGIDENGDLIHKTRTQEYREAYAAFRELYKEGLINNGTNGIPDFREHKWDWKEDIITRTGSYIQMLYNVGSVYSLLVEEGRMVAEPSAFDMLACVDTGKGDLCYGYEGVRNHLAITTKRVKTEEQLRRVLQFLNDVNNAPCTILLKDGWEGISFGLDETDRNKKLNPWRYKSEHLKTGIVNAKGNKDFKSGFNGILTGFTSEENAYPYYVEWQREPLRLIQYQLEDEYRDNCVINYGFPFIAPTQEEIGEELEAKLFEAEVQYIVGEIDEEGFEAALNQWWENGGATITEEINALYHAAGY